MRDLSQFKQAYYKLKTTTQSKHQASKTSLVSADDSEILRFQLQEMEKSNSAMQDRIDQLQSDLECVLKDNEEKN